MNLGPIEMLMIRFPGTELNGDIVPALQELVEQGTVRLVDLLFITKNDAGDVRIFELDELAPDLAGRFQPLASDITTLLNEEDAHEMASSLEHNSSAGILLFENPWATRFAQAVRAAHGEVLLNERIPHQVVTEILAADNATSGA